MFFFVLKLYYLLYMLKKSRFILFLRHVEFTNSVYFEQC